MVFNENKKNKHSRIAVFIIKITVPTGIEPAISCVTGRHVNRYTTGPKKQKKTDQRRLTLTGGDPQLPSAQKSLTAVFGMGTGVASLPSSLDYFSLELVRSKLDTRH